MRSFLRKLGRAFLFQGFDDGPSAHDLVESERLAAPKQSERDGSVPWLADHVSENSSRGVPRLGRHVPVRHDDGSVPAASLKGTRPATASSQSRQSLERKPAWVYSGDCRTATAILDTNCGSIHVRFFYDKAPNHVRRFLDLAGSGFYESTLFHRVIPGFLIQGGDPLTRDPAYVEDYGRGGAVDDCGNSLHVAAEANDLTHKRGTLSMARASDPDSASSQFFIVVADSPFLDGQFTAFGEVTLGMDVVDRIVAKSDADTTDERTGGAPRFYQKLFRVSIFA